MAYLLSEDKNKGNCVSFKAHKDLQRGELLEIVGKADGVIGNLDLYEVQTATATTERGNLLVHNSVTKMYDNSKFESDFILKKGEAGRGRCPKEHCVHTIAKAIITGEVIAKDKLKLAADGKLEKDTAGDATVAIVEEVLNFHGQESVMIRWI